MFEIFCIILFFHMEIERIIGPEHFEVMSKRNQKKVRRMKSELENLEAMCRAIGRVPPTESYMKEIKEFTVKALLQVFYWFVVCVMYWIYFIRWSFSDIMYLKYIGLTIFVLTILSILMNKLCKERGRGILRVFRRADAIISMLLLSGVVAIRMFL